MPELTINAEEIAAALRQHVEGFRPSLDQAQVGRVLEVGDGIARVAGLPNAAVNELLEFEGGAQGLALNLEEETIGAVILGDANTIQEGQEMEFEIENDVRGRGQRATNVELTNSAYNAQR